MSHVVGPKGQVVIEKAIRDRLGVQPGWRALQLVVNGHVEIHFAPPEHARSLAGYLSKYARPDLDTPDALHEAREAAWGEAVQRRVDDRSADEPEGRE